MSFMTMALGLTVAISSLRVFGDERVVFWREAAPGSGMKLDMLAYFVAKNLVEVPRLILLTAFFVLALYPTVTPGTSLGDLLLTSCVAAFAVSGLAYLASIALKPLAAQLVVVIYVLVAVMFSGLATRLATLSENNLFWAASYLSYARVTLLYTKIIIETHRGPSLCLVLPNLVFVLARAPTSRYARWHGELVFLTTVKSMSVAWRMPPTYYKGSSYSTLASLIVLGYTPQDITIWVDTILLVLLGIFFRILAFYSLILFNRDKRGLQTLWQMCIYWVVNPLDRWSRRRKERRSLRLDAASANARYPEGFLAPNPSPDSTAHKRTLE